VREGDKVKRGMTKDRHSLNAYEIGYMRRCSFMLPVGEGSENISYC